MRTPRQKRRTAWLASSEHCQTSVGREALEGDTLITKKSRKPPMWMLERMTDKGKIEAVLMKHKSPGRAGWDLLLPGGFERYFTTRGKALDMFNRLVITGDPSEQKISEEAATTF